MLYAACCRLVQLQVLQVVDSNLVILTQLLSPIFFHVCHSVVDDKLTDSVLQFANNISNSYTK